MQPIPLRTTVIGSYPFPAWLEFASAHLEQFGNDDIAEMVNDAVVAAIHDQLEARTDVITDGEQTRLDFNLFFYGYLDGIQSEPASPRRWGPPRTTNEASMQSSANLPRRTASARWRNSSVCNGSRRTPKTRRR